MAQLTDNLSQPTSGRETERPIDPGPSIFESIVKFGSSALSSVQKGQDVMADKAKKERQARLDAQEAAETAAKNDTAAISAAAILGDGSPEAEAARADANALGQQLSPIGVAVAQGRADEAAVRLRYSAAARAALARHPGQAAVIMATLKEHGIFTPETRRQERVNALIAQDEKDALEAENKIEEFAIVKMGVDYHNLTPPNQALIRRDALKRMAANERLAQQDTAMRISASASAQERARVEADKPVASQNAATLMVNHLSTFLNPIMVSAQQIMDSNQPQDVIDAQLTKLVRGVETQGELELNQLLATYGGAYMSDTDRSYVKERYQGMLGNIKALIEGPTSVKAQNMRQVEILRSVLGAETERALPLWGRLRGALGNNNILMQELTNRIAEDPKIQDAIKREMMGLTEKAGVGGAANQSTVLLNNLVNLLGRDGQNVALNMSQKEAAQMTIPALETAVRLTNNPIVKTGKDPDAYIGALQALAPVTNSMIEAIPMWGERGLTKGLNMALSQGVLDALTLRNSPDEVLRESTLDAYLPATLNMYNALKAAPSNDKYYTFVWNPANHNEGHRVVPGAGWRVQRNNVPDPPRRGVAVGIITTPGLLGTAKPVVSDGLLARVNVMNKAVKALSMFGSNGWDDSVPKGLTNNQYREFYGQGNTSAVRRAQAAQPTARPMSVNVDEVLKNSMEGIRGFKFEPGDTRPLPSEIGVEIAATENNTGNPAAKNPESSATGDGQFISKTWIEVMSTFPEMNPEGKSWKQLWDDKKERNRLLAYRTDSGWSNRASAKYSEMNRERIKQAGYDGPWTMREVHTAHFLGPQDAAKVLKASPDTPITQVVSAESIARNRGVFKGVRTVGDFMSGYIARRVDRGKRKVQQARRNTGGGGQEGAR